MAYLRQHIYSTVHINRFAATEQQHKCRRNKVVLMTPVHWMYITCPCATPFPAHTNTFVPLDTSPPARAALSSLSSDILFLSFLFSSQLYSCDQALFHMTPESRFEGAGNILLQRTPAEIAVSSFWLSNLSLCLHFQCHACSCFTKHISNRGIVHGASIRFRVSHL